MFKNTKHKCGHSAFSNILTSFERNNLWYDDDVQRCLCVFILTGTACVDSTTPPPFQKVALGSIKQPLNDVFMVDLLYLDNNRLFYCSDSCTRFSVVYIASDANILSAPLPFETTRTSQFCTPLSVKGQPSFAKHAF